MQDKIKISIVTVVFNGAHTINDAIDSVLVQKYQNVEYIVIDGGSMDETIKIIKKHAGNISFWVSEPDKGIYDAMNKGIGMATGDIIGVLNSDDVYANPDVLASVAGAFKTGCDCCYSDLVYVDRGLDKVIRHWNSGEYVPGSFRKGWHPPHPTFFAKKTLYDRYGLFNTGYKIAADYEIMLRFLERYGASVRYIPEVAVKMRVGGASNRSVSNIAKANMEVRRAWVDNGLAPPPFIYLRKPLSKLKQLVLPGSTNFGENC